MHPRSASFELQANAQVQPYLLVQLQIPDGSTPNDASVDDLGGDGRAEVACKTADGTVDGTDKTIGDANADYRDRRGYVLDGQRPSLVMCRGYYTRAVLADA